jgi:hypothetical protein
VRDPGGAGGFWSDAQRFLKTYLDGEAEPYVGSV